MPRVWFRIFLLAMIAGACALTTTASFAKITTTTYGSIDRARSAVAGARSWCAPEIETLPGDACYLDGVANGQHASQARRTLVVFLHGAIAKNTDWSWKHERMLQRVAKATNLEMIFPRSPLTEVGYVWPGSVEAQEKVEQQLIDGWVEAKDALEKRDNRPFDDIFVMGFSSGAYFASSLAMRGRLDFADGYAVFAGGQPMAPAASPVHHFSPVFVGICASDSTTASHSRAFATSLSGANIPRAAQERPVGHGLDHVHFNSALSYLRNQHKSLRAAKR